MIDKYGRTITYTYIDGEDVYSIDGLTMSWPSGADDAKVIEAFNAQAPADWTPPPVVPEVISDRQFFQMAALLEIITQAEALAAVKTGDIPANLQAIVDAIPSPIEKFSATMLLSGATEFARYHPLTESVAQSLGWTSEQIDQFFIAAAQL